MTVRIPSRRYPKAARLLKRVDFRRVQGKGTRVFGSHLIARYSTRDGVARFGITVSRKVGNAVVRNRVKRWIREAIRHERGELRGVDLVFIARRSSANAGFSEIQSDVIAALQRARRSQVGSGSDL